MTDSSSQSSSFTQWLLTVSKEILSVQAKIVTQAMIICHNKWTHMAELTFWKIFFKLSVGSQVWQISLAPLKIFGNYWETLLRFLSNMTRLQMKEQTVQICLFKFMIEMTFFYRMNSGRGLLPTAFHCSVLPIATFSLQPKLRLQP